MDRIKLGFLIFILLLFAGMFCGCGNKGGNPEGSLTFQDGQEDMDTLFIYYGTSENAVMMERLCVDYEAETGVHILWEAADHGTAELKKRFASNEAPDLFSIARQDLPAWSGRLADFSNEPWVDDLMDSAREAATVDGQVKAWPHALEANGIVYNKRLFEQAGIEDVPETLDELAVVCEKLKQVGIQSFGESWMQFGYLAHLLAAPFAFEGTAETAGKMSEGKLTFHDLKYMDKYFVFLDLTLDYGFGSRSIEYSTFYQYADFAAGNMAMMKQGTWSERRLLELEPELEIGLFALPLSNNPEDNKLLTSTTTFLCVNKDSRKREQACDFICWWHENAGYYLVGLNGTAVPFQSADGSGLGALNRDMFRYMENGSFYGDFGYEYWPANFHEDSAEVVKAYIMGLATEEETRQKLTQLYQREGTSVD